jgi:hypothetical protein
VAERWIQSVRRECLDHFVVFGEAHLRYIVDEYWSAITSAGYTRSWATGRCWPQALHHRLNQWSSRMWSIRSAWAGCSSTIADRPPERLLAASHGPGPGTRDCPRLPPTVDRSGYKWFALLPDEQLSRIGRQSTANITGFSWPRSDPDVEATYVGQPI